MVAASLVGALVKSITGMGFPLIAIPALALFIGVEDAVVIVSIPNSAANLMLNRGARAHQSETRDLPVLIVSSVAGAIIGTFLFIEAPEEPLLLGLAATVLVFVVQRLRSPDLRLAPATTRRWAPVAGTIAGVSQGAVGVSGPVVAMWFHGYRLSKDAYVFSVTALFLMSGLAQLVVLAAAGEFSRDRLVASGAALIATLAVIPVGIRMRDRVDVPTFERLILVLLIVSGGSLVVRALT